PMCLWMASSASGRRFWHSDPGHSGKMPSKSISGYWHSSIHSSSSRCHFGGTRPLSAPRQRKEGKHMHGKRGLNLLILVFVIGPLIWMSQQMHWGDTGTFVCVVIGLVGGWFLLRGGKSVSKKVSRTFNHGKPGAATDFMFSPSEPFYHQQQLLQYRKQAQN